MINRIPEWLRRLGPFVVWPLAGRTAYTAIQSSNGVVRTLGIVSAVLVVGLLLLELWERHRPRPKRRKSQEREVDAEEPETT